MKKNRFYTLLYIIYIAFFGGSSMIELQAQQVANAGFEDWTAPKFAGQIQPVGWNASNVTQFYFKFNFAHRAPGHNGNYCMMVQDQQMGGAGISQISPGYFSLGTPWVYIADISCIPAATAGTYGGIGWSYRPDSMRVWIRRTGKDALKEDFYLLYYAWHGTSVGSAYKGRNGSCVPISFTNEESDIRQALNRNECTTAQYATQVAEGLWRERCVYDNWTCITVPIYYLNDDAPTMMNLIFSASNYPNFRASDGYYPGNSLYVDDVEFVYSSSIQTLLIGGKEWKDFDPTKREQTYVLPPKTKILPSIEARRGRGVLRNARGERAVFPGRKLDGQECMITPGAINGAPTKLHVQSGDSRKFTDYYIYFKK